MRLAGVERPSLTLGSELTGAEGVTCTTGLGAAGGSCVFSRVSTCSVAPIACQRLLIQESPCRCKKGGSRRTQTLFQSLDISALGATLPADLVVSTVVAQPRTCATARAVAVAPELPLPTYHTSQAFGLGDIGVVWGMGGRGACARLTSRVHLDNESVLCLLDAIHGRVCVRRCGHCDRATDRPVGMRRECGRAAASGRVRSRAAADATGGLGCVCSGLEDLGRGTSWRPDRGRGLCCRSSVGTRLGSGRGG